MNPQASRARDLLVAKRPDEAIKVLLEGLAAYPDDSELHCLLAQAHIVARRPAEALRAATDAVRIAPDEEWAHRLRSIALRQLGKKSEAVDAAAEAVRLEPALSTAHLTLAEAQLAAGHADQAYAEASEARRLDPESSDVYDTLGRCLLVKKQFAGAEASFRQALELDPNDAAAHNNLGVALQRQGRRVDAVHAYNAAAKIDPTFETARKNVYSSTQRLVGGGLAVAAIFTIIRLGSLINSFRHPSIFTAVIAALLVVGIVIFARRSWPVGTKQLPATAVAYYKAETRRLNAQRRPVQWLRLGSILVAIGIFVVSFVLNAMNEVAVSALLFFLALPAAAALYAMSPMIWRRISRARRPEG
ncbi:MAG TPA: tetratricopeptide repeat protein [Candidatus Acidoferrum sp.]|nr:tetratricopeptide repeat protein [Candidatus Acidoferrum sp.]